MSPPTCWGSNQYIPNGVEKWHGTVLKLISPEWFREGGCRERRRGEMMKSSPRTMDETMAEFPITCCRFRHARLIAVKTLSEIPQSQVPNCVLGIFAWKFIRIGTPLRDFQYLWIFGKIRCWGYALPWWLGTKPCAGMPGSPYGTIPLIQLQSSMHNLNGLGLSTPSNTVSYEYHHTGSSVWKANELLIRMPSLDCLLFSFKWAGMIEKCVRAWTWTQWVGPVGRSTLHHSLTIYVYPTADIPGTKEVGHGRACTANLAGKEAGLADQPKISVLLITYRTNQRGWNLCKRSQGLLWKSRLYRNLWQKKDMVYAFW